MVATFGILGAYFRRLLSFQAKLSTLDFEDVVNIYEMRPLLVRLLYGMIGAIVFYYVLRSARVCPSILGCPADAKSAATDFKMLLATSELSKLLVWSFLAGFSERLLPDTLDGVENRAKDGK